MNDITGLEQFDEHKEETAPWIKYIIQMLYDDIPSCTRSQRGYIYGMCKKIGYDEHCLPTHVSHVEDPRDMNIEEATAAIDVLIKEVNEMEGKYFEKYGEKQRYGKSARR